MWDLLTQLPSSSRCCSSSSSYGWMAESAIILAEAALMVACSPKSNSACVGIEKALKDIQDRNIGQVPSHLRIPIMVEPKIWDMARDINIHMIIPMEEPINNTCLTLRGRKYYVPKDAGAETHIKNSLMEYTRETQDSAILDTIRNQNKHW